MSASERILIGPGCLDCNRGDQALVWQAIDCVRRACPGCELAIMAEGHDDPEDPQTRQTRKLGIRVLASLLPNPRRAATRGKREVIDSGWSLGKMVIQAALDFHRTLCLLIWPRNRRLARWILGSERQATYEFLRGSRALVIKGGGFIYAYRGLRWAYYLWFQLFCLLLSQRLGVKVIILPNSFGPFDIACLRGLVRRVVGRCDFVSTREPRSLEVLNGIVPGKARLFPDMGFGLEAADASWAAVEHARLGVPVDTARCVGVTMRPWRFPQARDPGGAYQRYIQAFARLLEHLVSGGYVPVLCAHVIGPHAHEDDRIALNDALSATSVAARVHFVDGDYDCRQIKALYRSMAFMVCTRFHSAIFSIAQNVACMAVSYQGYKAPGIMSEIGIGDYCLAIDALDAESLIAMFDRLVVHEDELRQKMRAYVATCRKRLEVLEEMVTAEIRSPE